ncbi:MAG: hypothetical protein NT023_06545, partial [Armatimonadetes bacterium]|nr:hypothetical protein [Armatimonadota bacterium]
MGLLMLFNLIYPLTSPQTLSKQEFRVVALHITSPVTTQPSPCPAGIPLPIREKDLYREVILLFSM